MNGVMDEIVMIKGGEKIGKFWNCNKCNLPEHVSWPQRFPAEFADAEYPSLRLTENVKHNKCDVCQIPAQNSDGALCAEKFCINLKT